MEIWESHRQTARDNLEFADKLKSLGEVQYSNWIAVILFYSAMHYVHAILAKKGEKVPDRHKDSNGVKGTVTCAKEIFPTDIFDCYDRLFRLGQNARYIVPPLKHAKLVDQCSKAANRVAKHSESELSK